MQNGGNLIVMFLVCIGSAEMNQQILSNLFKCGELRDVKQDPICVLGQRLHVEFLEQSQPTFLEAFGLGVNQPQRLEYLGSELKEDDYYVPPKSNTWHKRDGLRVSNKIFRLAANSCFRRRKYLSQRIQFRMWRRRPKNFVSIQLSRVSFVVSTILSIIFIAAARFMLKLKIATNMDIVPRWLKKKV